jgi:hypothetical protein
VVIAVKPQHIRQIGRGQNVGVQDPKARFGGDPVTIGEQRSRTAEQCGFFRDLYLQTMTILAQKSAYGMYMGVSIDEDLVDPVPTTKVKPDAQYG